MINTGSGGRDRNFSAIIDQGAVHLYVGEDIKFFGITLSIAVSPKLDIVNRQLDVHSYLQIRTRAVGGERSEIASAAYTGIPHTYTRRYCAV